MRLNYLWDNLLFGYRLKNLTRHDILAVDSKIPYKFMKNLLNRLVNRRKKSIRQAVHLRNSGTAQISRLGLLGQSLIVMSR